MNKEAIGAEAALMHEAEVKVTVDMVGEWGGVCNDVMAYAEAECADGAEAWSWSVTAPQTDVLPYMAFDGHARDKAQAVCRARIAAKWLEKQRRGIKQTPPSRGARDGQG